MPEFSYRRLVTKRQTLPMRHYIKSIIITAASLYITMSLIPTVSLGSEPKNYALVLMGLWVISQIVNPVFSLVLLPVNLITFGLVSFLLNVAFVFALINFLPSFSVAAYNFPGAQIDGVILPALYFNEIGTIILVAATITVLQKVLHLIFE